jgi:N6-L-threonylcarbamoyladenine synthase
MMGLGYPGGPIIEKLALEGDEDRFALPVPLRNSPLIAFSLSGLKNAVRLEVEKLGGATSMTHQDKCDLSASFQKAVKLHLLQKSKKIFKQEPTKTVALVGGASANLYIRKAYEKLCDEFGKEMIVAPLQYCSDNAAMIGRYAIDAYHQKRFVEPNKIDIVATKKLQQGMML